MQGVDVHPLHDYMLNVPCISRWGAHVLYVAWLTAACDTCWKPWNSKLQAWAVDIAVHWYLCEQPYDTGNEH